MDYPDLAGWTTETIPGQSFEKVGGIAMSAEWLAIYSARDTRVFVPKNGDIDPVLDGDTPDVMSGLCPVGKARLSTSGKALNIAISPYYYTVPLRSVLAVLDGRNRKGALWVGNNLYFPKIKKTIFISCIEEETYEISLLKAATNKFTRDIDCLVTSLNNHVSGGFPECI